MCCQSLRAQQKKHVKLDSESRHFVTQSPILIAAHCKQMPMNRATSIVMIAALLLVGCASTSPAPVAVTYDVDGFGAVYPVVDGVPYQLTEAERRRVVVGLLRAYDCPVVIDEASQ